MLKSKVIVKSLAAVVAVSSVLSAGLFRSSKTVSAASVAYPAAVANMALSQVGYVEGSDNWTKYSKDINEKWSKFYGFDCQKYAWCDIFVDWCFLQTYGYDTALSLLCQRSGENGTHCFTSEGFYKTRGTYIPKGQGTPQVGDQIFTPGSGGKGHTGLVVGVIGDTVYTVEGNAGSNCDRVVLKPRSISKDNIRGYGRPRYASSAYDATRGFVNGLYKNLMGRTPSYNEVTNWALPLYKGYGSACGVDVVWGFFNSAEFQKKNLSNEAFVARLYRALLGREADSGGYNFWVGCLRNGTSRQNVLSDFMKSQEFKNKCNACNVIYG